MFKLITITLLILKILTEFKNVQSAPITDDENKPEQGLEWAAKRDNDEPVLTGRSFNPFPSRSHHHRPPPFTEDFDFKGFGPHHHHRGPVGPPGPPPDFDYFSTDDDDCEYGAFGNNVGHKHHHHRPKHGHNHHHHGNKNKATTEKIQPTTEKIKPETKPIVEDTSGDIPNPSSFEFTSAIKRTTPIASATEQNIKTTTPLFDVRLGKI